VELWGKASRKLESEKHDINFALIITDDVNVGFKEFVIAEESYVRSNSL